MSECKGCGAPLPPNKAPGRERVWCSERCRKNQYDLTCVECGGRVDGTTPGKIPNRDEPVCGQCASGHYAVWTQEAILCAIQEWADEHGGIPPTSTEWLKANRGPYPTVLTVQRRFGSWAAAVRAAGFEPHRPGSPGRPFPHDMRRTCVERYAAGESSTVIAADFGCAPMTITKWARAAGVPIRGQFGRHAQVAA